MPTDTDYSMHEDALYRAAVARVRAKFPAIIEGSTGWYRALDNEARKRRL